MCVPGFPLWTPGISPPAPRLGTIPTPRPRASPENEARLSQKFSRKGAKRKFASSFPISRLGLPCRVAAYVNAKRTLQSPAGDNAIGGETPFRSGGGKQSFPDKGVTNLEIRNEGIPAPHLLLCQRKIAQIEILG